MNKLVQKALRRLNIAIALALAIIVAGGFGGITYVFASSTSNFTQTIGAGTLATDIVNGTYVTVGSPTMAMSSANFSLVCQTVTGSFGTASEQIYVTNPDAADGGWTLSLAAATPATDVWDGAASDFDYNDPAGSGCTDTTDDDDVDLVGGQMTVNPAAGTLAVGQCASCVVTNVTKGSSAAVDVAPVNSITVLTGAAGSDDIGDWTLQGVAISQKIPAEQAAAADYDINMVLSIVAAG